ncbi:MAG: hypothetical protein L0Y56_08085 [Nitrospira sp.]|nr:hypothetical protein [Nitrospira sp.]
MKYKPDIHHRRSIRLKGYDYAQAGAYFLTICAQNRECLFGDVVDGMMQLSQFGRVVEGEWLRTVTVRPNIKLDVFVIMPNHFHGIIVLTDIIQAVHREGVGATRRVAPTKHPTGPISGSVGAIVGQFKSITSKRTNEMRNTPGIPVWQRNYYEHIIRNEQDLSQIREYILNNPVKWELDELYPDKLGRGDPPGRPYGMCSGINWIKIYYTKALFLDIIRRTY